MPPKISDSVSKKIIRFWIKGFSQSKISQISGVSVGAIRRIIATHKEHKSMEMPKEQTDTQKQPGLIKRVRRFFRKLIS